MKRKYFYGILIAFLSMFLIHACTSDYSLDAEDQALQDDGSDGTDDGDGTNDGDDDTVFITYCKYNVTKSSVPGLKKSDIACTPCPPGGADCDKTIVAYEVQYPVGTVVGHIDGDLVNSDLKCKSCPSDGYITN